jgi:hypothetical protein
MHFSQAPHHTANSWSSYWGRDPLTGRLLASARERVAGGQGSTGNGEKEEVDSEVEDDQETVEEESSLGLDSDKDDTATSGHGHFFKAAEIKTMAKYIARYNPDDWAMMSGKQRWLPYHLEVTLLDDHMETFANLKLSFQHPHRSERAYCMKYRSKEQGMFSEDIIDPKVETVS